MIEVTTVNAIAILPSQEDRLSLGNIFRHSNWHLEVTECLRGARTLLSASHIGVVVTDCHFPDGGWKDVLDEVERRPIKAPPVIGVSRRADERLWAEVLNLRGYDVLATPFHADEVRWSIRSACRHWRDNCLLNNHEPPAGATQSRSTAQAPNIEKDGGRNSVRIPRDGNQPK
jgi:DNA-binding response OmpR family regulator